MSHSADIERWLTDYEKAWSTDSAEAVAGLFTADARYFTAPYRPPLVGVEDLARWWIDQAESTTSWTFERAVIASEGGLHVIRGTVTYPDAPGPGGKPAVYHNIWLVTLAEDGRAREFVEYWMLEE